MRRLHSVLERLNRDLFNPAGLNLLSPLHSAFLFVRAPFFLSSSFVASPPFIVSTGGPAAGGRERARAGERGAASCDVRSRSPCAVGPGGLSCVRSRSGGKHVASSVVSPVGLLLTVPPLALSLLAARWQLHAARDRVLLIGASAKV